MNRLTVSAVVQQQSHTQIYDQRFRLMMTKLWSEPAQNRLQSQFVPLRRSVPLTSLPAALKLFPESSKTFRTSNIQSAATETRVLLRTTV